MAGGSWRTRDSTVTIIVSGLLVVVAFAGQPGGVTALRELRASLANPGVWENVTPPASPSSRLTPSMAYDSVRHRVLLFGGGVSANDTWSYDPGASRWTNLDPRNPPRMGWMGTAAMVYDVHADRFIVYGVGVWPNETWAYDPVANAWMNLNPPESPFPRHDPGIVYDAAEDLILLFGGGVLGGQHYYSAYDDTWAYDYNANTWTLLHPVVSPDRRFGAAMTYDPVEDQVVLFGGCANGLDIECNLVNDTWAYSYRWGNWTNLSPPASPSPRHLAAVTYDSRDRAMILFGGADERGIYDRSANLNETWTYSLTANRWTNESPSPSPPGRRQGAMAYDPLEDEAVLFGGYAYADTWAYRLGIGPIPTSQPPNTLLIGLLFILAAPAGAAVIWLVAGRAWRKNER
jgi:hypothetical protein